MPSYVFCKSWLTHRARSASSGWPRLAVFDLSCLVIFGETTAYSSDLIVPSSREFGARATKSLVFSIFFEISYDGGVNAGQWGRAKPSPVCAVIELEARVRPGGDGRGFVTGAGVVDFAGFGIGSCGGRSCSGCRKASRGPGQCGPRPKRARRPTKSRRVGISGRAAKFPAPGF